MGCFECGNQVAPFANGEKPDLIGTFHRRSCRDVFCLLVFLVFIAGHVFVMYLAIWLGDPQRLIYGTDSWGNICSKNNKKIDGVPLSGIDCSLKRNLFFYDKDVFRNYIPGVHISVDTVALCVRTCPSHPITTVEGLQSFYNTTRSSLCWYGRPQESFFDGGPTSECPALPVEQHEAFLYRCIPTTFKQPFEIITGAINDIFNKIDENFAEKCLSDLENTWREICYLSAIALAISLVIVVLFRFIASVIIWSMVIILSLGSIVGTGLCWYRYYRIKSGDVVVSSSEEKGWLIGSICASIITVVILLILLIMRKRIGLVVQLFKEAGKAVGSIPFLLIQPLWTLLIIVGVLVIVAYTVLGIESAGHISIANLTGFVTYSKDESLQHLKWYYILGAIWVLQFILACEEITIAGAVAGWYFERKTGSEGFPIVRSALRLIRYHLGSAAFGAFVITLFKIINLMMSFIQNRLKNNSGSVVDFFMKCLRCCLWCFEKAIKFLSSNAYIEIAIVGFGFCHSAKRAFTIIVNNSLRLAAINSIGDFTLFLGKAGTVAVVASVGMELLAARSDVFYTWLPITLSCITAYLISSCLIGIYELCIDTIFICFCEDCDRNNGKDRPYCMSTGLLKFVNKCQEEKVEVKT